MNTKMEFNDAVDKICKEVEDLIMHKNGFYILSGGFANSKVITDENPPDVPYSNIPISVEFGVCNESENCSYFAEFNIPYHSILDLMLGKDIKQVIQTVKSI